uniref:Uncharacterized protein n=1 Tax=Myotis myotis TaxID=51298 RepID=A0A7J7TTR6_MYOMY|nr:hypothetical protein mMyoMyo1_008977 [Myotis myotis]
MLSTGRGCGHCTAGNSDGRYPDVAATTSRFLRGEQGRTRRQLEQRRHSLKEGNPFLQVPPPGESRGRPTRSLPLPCTALAPRPASRGSVPRSRRRAGCGAGGRCGEEVEPRGRAWRGRGRSARTPFAPGPFPSNRRRPMAGRKMAARSATDSHVSPRYCRAPPPPPGESPTPWEALPGQPLGGRGNSSAGAGEGKGAAAEGHLSPHATPNPGAGVLRRKPCVGQPAPARATGHAPQASGSPGFLATPRAGRGAGPGRAGAARRRRETRRLQLVPPSQREQASGGGPAGGRRRRRCLPCFGALVGGQNWKTVREVPGRPF